MWKIQTASVCLLSPPSHASLYSSDSTDWGKWQSIMWPKVRGRPLFRLLRPGSEAVHRCSSIKKQRVYALDCCVVWKERGGLISTAQTFVSTYFWHRLEISNDCGFAITLHFKFTLFIRLKLMNLNQFFAKTMFFCSLNRDTQWLSLSVSRHEHMNKEAADVKCDIQN